MLPKRIDVLAEISTSDSIRAFDELQLDLELRKTGLDPDGLPGRLEAFLDAKLRTAACPGGARLAGPATQSANDNVAAASLGRVQQPCMDAPAAAADACAPAPDTFELAGIVKFFDASRGYGFITADDGSGDAIIHVSCLEAAGYRTAYEGTRIHAMVRRSTRGLQAVSVLSMDESGARHPSLQPQRTRHKVHAQSDWVQATVKWYDRVRGYGFVNEGAGAPDCFLHADTLRRWGMAPPRPGQVVEIRWGMGSDGRMVAEIRHLEGLPPLPPVH